MIQVQKGIVNYQGRNDIECTYAITEDGKQYYFLIWEDMLSNGNIIVSPNLVEAIDSQFIASSIGVINQTGDIIIPFVNKAVKPISTGLLLVEKAHPTTESVIEAVQLRKDPLAATKLVTTPATIKDRMNSQMNGGRFVFNDQFSEATICDLEGKNLIDDKYYSFIGVNGSEVYFSGNTIDSEIKHFSLNEIKKEEPLEEKSIIEEKVTEEPVVESTLDVRETGIDPNVIEEAIQAESVIPEVEEVPVADIFRPIESQNIIETSDFPEVSVDSSSEVTLNDDIFSKKEEVPEVAVDTQVAKQDNSSTSDKFKIIGGNFDEINNQQGEESKIDTSVVEAETSVAEVPVKDSVIDDVTITMARLIAQNKEQREKNTEQNERIQFQELQMKKILNKSRQIVNENEDLRDQIQLMGDENSVLKNMNADLTTQNGILNDTIHDQTNIIDFQNSEIQKLRPQAAGNAELVRLLGDAQMLLGGDISSNVVSMPAEKAKVA